MPQPPQLNAATRAATAGNPMINPIVFFVTGDYSDPQQAPSTERAAHTLINQWVERVTQFNRNAVIPCIPVGGSHAASAEEYDTIAQILRSAAHPVPVAIQLHRRCIMWVEDPRGMPESLRNARATLQYVDLARKSRLPF